MDLFDIELGEIVFFVVSAGIGAFGGAYLKEFGKFKLLEEKQAEILKQQGKIVTQSETIKAEFDGVKVALQHQSWIDEQRWQFRKDLFLELIEILLEARQHALDIDKLVLDAHKYAQGLTSGDDEPSAEVENHAAYIVDEARAAAEEIIGGKLTPLNESLKSLLNKKGILFLSNEVIASISRFLNSSTVWEKEVLDKFNLEVKNGNASYDDRPDISYDQYLFHFSFAAERAYKEVIRIAKSDLKIGRQK